MNSFRLIAASETPVNAGMDATFDMRRDELTLAMTAQGERAARAAMGGTADWILTQLCMPVLDGFHFLAYLMDRCCELPIVLHNAPDSDDTRQYVLEPRASSLLPTPTGRRPWRPWANRVLHLGVTLVDFLRFCEEEHQTRVLEVASDRRTARFHLTFGKLIHAGYGEREGLDVFFELMRWKAPKLRILPTLPGAHISLTPPMEWLLQQAEALQHGPVSQDASAHAPLR